MNIPSAIVPPRAIGAYMVRVRANIIATHMLVLRNARNSFLQDDNQRAALLVRHMYHHCLNRHLSEKMLLFKGLPSYDIDAQVYASYSRFLLALYYVVFFYNRSLLTLFAPKPQRRRWGDYSSRFDSCDGCGFLLQHLVRILLPPIS
jgi:hypothetical protein